MNLRDKLKAIEKPKVKVTVQETQPAQPAFTDCWRTESTHVPADYPIRRETVMLMQGDDMPLAFDPERILYLDTETTGLMGAGTVAFEVGLGQFEDVMKIMEDAGYRYVQSRCDLAGIERVVWGVWDQPNHD